jgi:pyruvate/2-oxoglutarate dehydrogenase complex dihydrolipoamide acyltransferase (E2) component
MNMMANTFYKLAAAVGLALALSACAHQGSAALDEVGAPQVPATLSVEEADAKLKQSASEREAAENEFVARELECYDKFFVNNCLDKAKEKRRLTLVRLRAIDAEANYFKRAESVRLRDIDLARTQESARLDAEQRAAAVPKPVKVVTPEPAPPKPQGKSVAEREAEQAAKVAKQAAADAAEAPRRAAREAAYAKKQAEAVARQKRVAQRLAERQAEAQAKAAKAAAAAASTPAAAVPVPPAQ